VNSIPLKSGSSRIYYPAFIDITGKKCLVVGGGKVAERKVAMLLRFGANIVVVSPVIVKQLLKLVKEEKIQHFQRAYTEKDLAETALVFACTDNTTINKRIRKDAVRKKIPVNVVDDPALCDFIVPSIIKKGDLTIAIATSGTLPLLSKKLRQKIEEIITDDYLSYLTTIGQFRQQMIKTIKDKQKRETIMKKIEKMDMKNITPAKLASTMKKAMFS